MNPGHKREKPGGRSQGQQFCSRPREQPIWIEHVSATEGISQKKGEGGKNMINYLIDLTMRKILRKTFYKAIARYGRSQAKDLKAEKKIKTMNQAIINFRQNKSL